MPELNLDNKDVIEIQNTRFADDLPDLIIEDIFTKPGWNPYVTDYACLIRNIGDGEADGWIDVEVEVIVEWLLFGKIPRKEIYNFEVSFYHHPPIQLGETVYTVFASNEDFNDIGKLSFSAVVNPDHTMDESDYDNNFYEEEMTLSLIRSRTRYSSISILLPQFLERFPILHKVLLYLLK